MLTKVFHSNNVNDIEYNDIKQVKSLQNNSGDKYEFDYDKFGRIINTKFNGTIINSYTYKDEMLNGVQDITMINTFTDLLLDYTYQYFYNDDQQLHLVKLNGDSFIEYSYDSKGRISQIIDYKENITTSYEYDSSNRILKEVKNSGDINQYYYNEENDVVLKNVVLNNITQSTQ